MRGQPWFDLTGSLVRTREKGPGEGRTGGVGVETDEVRVDRGDGGEPIGVQNER